MSTLILLLSILLPPAAMPASVLKDPGQVALREEMNLLVYGVMQFSEALHNLYDSTAQKLDRIGRRTGIYEQGLRSLRHQTQNARRGHEEIRGAVERLMVEDMQRRQEAQDCEKGLQRLTVSHQHLVQQVKALQEVLDLVEQQGLQGKRLDLAALKPYEDCCRSVTNGRAIRKKLEEKDIQPVASRPNKSSDGTFRQLPPD